MSESEPLDFEATLEELDEIARALDRDDLGLDEAIALFERGIARLRAANEWLERASGRVEEIIATGTGGLETRPLDGADGGETDGDAAG